MAVTSIAKTIKQLHGKYKKRLNSSDFQKIFIYDAKGSGPKVLEILSFMIKQEQRCIAAPKYPGIRRFVSIIQKFDLLNIILKFNVNTASDLFKLVAWDNTQDVLIAKQRNEFLSEYFGSELTVH